MIFIFGNYIHIFFSPNESSIALGIVLALCVRGSPSSLYSGTLVYFFFFIFKGADSSKLLSDRMQVKSCFWSEISNLTWISSFTIEKNIQLSLLYPYLNNVYFVGVCKRRAVHLLLNFIQTKLKEYDTTFVGIRATHCNKGICIWQLMRYNYP